MIDLIFAFQWNDEVILCLVFISWWHGTYWYIVDCDNFWSLVFYQRSEHLGQKTQGKSEITIIMSTFSWSVIFAIVLYIKVRRKAPVTHLFLIFFSSSIMMKTYFEKLHVDIYSSRVTSISQSFESKQHFTFTSYYFKWESPSLSITQSI